MKITNNCINLIKKFEGLRLSAYPDPGTGGEPWTIGYGSTYYEDGSKVRKGDKISINRAESLLVTHVASFAKKVEKLVTSSITSNQFDALVSFAYNVGVGNFSKSTLLKKVNANPSDKTISLEFEKWVRAAGKVLPGLVKRRKEEARLYNSI